jgi:hypothetical protein
VWRSHLDTGNAELGQRRAYETNTNAPSIYSYASPTGTMCSDLSFYEARLDYLVRHVSSPPQARYQLLETLTLLPETKFQTLTAKHTDAVTDNAR